MQFLLFLSIFFIPALSRPSFPTRTPNKDEKIEQLLYFLLVQVLYPGDIHELRGKRFCHATRKRSQKVPRIKSGTFWFPWMDSHDSTPIQ